MPIAFDTFSGGSVASSSLTVSHTVGSLTNGFLIAGVSVRGSTSDVLTSVTYNGVAMSRLLPAVNGNLSDMFTYMYGIPNPPSGAHNIVATCSSSQIIRMANGSYSDVLQSGQPDNSGSAVAGGTSVTATVNVKSTNCWIVSVIQDDGALVCTPGGSLTTSRGTDGANVVTLGDSNGSVSTGNRNATWTSGSQQLGVAAISLLAIESKKPTTGAFFTMFRP